MSWFTNLKISLKLMVSYLILCIIMLGVGGMGVIGLNTMKENLNALYYDAFTGISNIKDVLVSIESVRLLVQQSVLAEYRYKIPSLESEIQNAVENTNAALKIYSESITDPDDRNSFQELERLLNTYREVREKVIDTAKQGDYATAAIIYQNQFVPASDMVISHIDTMIVWNENVGKSYIEIALDSFSAAMMNMIITIVAGLIFAIVCGFFITRSIVAPLSRVVNVANEVAAGNLAHNIEVKRKDELGQLESAIKSMVSNLRDVIMNVQGSADNVAASSEELTASADQSSQAANSVATSIMNVAQGSEKQLVIVGETVSIAEKMSLETEQIAANAGSVTASSDKTAQSAEQGRKAVETAINQMTSIQKTVENLAQEITGLGVRSKEIGQIVETISGIAGQTNLLALNAAIEAARAGEQGRGFAVVAEEVRKLAEQSQDAAKQISSLIGAIQEDTGKAVQAMEAGTREVKIGADLVDNAGTAFKEIEALIDQTSKQIREISQSIDQMANDSRTIVTGAQEINDVSKNTSALTQSVSAATEEQLASMQEIASSSQALSKRAEELQAVTQKFTL